MTVLCSYAHGLIPALAPSFQPATTQASIKQRKAEKGGVLLMLSVFFPDITHLP